MFRASGRFFYYKTGGGTRTSSGAARAVLDVSQGVSAAGAGSFVSSSSKPRPVFPSPLPYISGPDPARRRWFMGGLLTLLATGADTGGRFALIESLLRQGFEPPCHLHTREDESFYVLEGEIQFTVGEATCHLKAGDFIHLPRHVPHSYRLLSPTARTLLHLAPAGLEAMFEELSIAAERPELPPRPTGPPPPEMLARIDAVQRQLGIEMQQERIFGH